MPDSNANEITNSPIFQKVIFGTFSDGTLRAIRVDDNGNVLTVSGAPSTLIDGTVTTAGAAAVALGATTAISKVTVIADIANTDKVLIGNATTQNNPLFPGDAIDINIDDIATVFIKRSGAVDVTVTFLAS